MTNIGMNTKLIIIIIIPDALDDLSPLCSRYTNKEYIFTSQNTNSIMTSTSMNTKLTIIIIIIIIPDVLGDLSPLCSRYTNKEYIFTSQNK